MLCEKIALKENDPTVYLDTYVADKVGSHACKALLVIPGGGYCNVCSDREGEPIALAFLPHGYNAFVLHYSVARRAAYPAQLREVAMAIKHIKDNAERYNVDPDELFCVGFSAGGHLAASAGVFWNRPEVTEGLDMPAGYNRPTGVMPIYPVINYQGHNNSFCNLLCQDEPSPEALAYVEVDRHVSADSSPAFLMHTADDPTVDVRNTLSLAMAYTNAGVPYELHVYPHGPHGIALANSVTDMGWHEANQPAIAQWVEHATYWADTVCKNNKDTHK